MREQSFIDIEYSGEERCSIEEEPLPVYSPRESYLPNIQPALVPREHSISNENSETIAADVRITPLPPTYEESVIG
ncbi:hypothetical protein HDV06_002049 [Boothiomyces sp. JEL0866]|nr:hypothetical protein HDV06_002049 [Boothiomyces sp. JEL0866]